MWGIPTDEQERVIQSFVSGKTVHDLGAGELVLSRRLHDLGAACVVAIDSEPRSRAKPWEEKWLRVRKQTFAEVPKNEAIEVALVSWPRNLSLWFGTDGLPEIVARAGTVIYLGKSTDGMRCGCPRMWGILAARSVLRHVPHRRNTLIVYGPRVYRARELLHEERAARSPTVLQYEDCA